MSASAPPTDGVVPDPDHARVVQHRGGVMLVLGAPGTGRTQALTRHVQQRVADGLSSDACLVVAPTRQSAARLRSSIGAGLGITYAEPLARTASSLAFAVLRLAAARAAEPMPSLISGAEQDVVLRELLAGHHEAGTGPRWPDHLRPALTTAGFRGQLRDLLMRAVEHGLGREDLERLSVVHDRPEWACAAQLLEEYDQVTALSDPGSFDPAWICTAAADALEVDDGLRDLVHARVGFVGIDDAQEMTASAARLLDAVRPPGTDALLLGDPDATVLGFRGAVPGRFLELAQSWARQDGRGGQDGPERVLLRRRHGAGAAVGEVADRVAARIGVVGESGHRRPAPGGTASDVGQEGTARVRLARSPAQEAALVARWLRHAHLVEGVPWARLAVIARSGRQQDTIRRGLAAGGVPVRADRSGLPLGADPAVVPLLLAFDVATRPEATHGWTLTGEEAVTLLMSPLGGLDPVGLRRLRRHVRAAELATQGRRSADELLAEAVSDPELRRTSPALLPPDLEPVVRLGHIVEAGWQAHQQVDGGAGHGQGAADEVLWALWSASGLATAWGEQALEGRVVGARADRDLDAVLVLFATAQRYVQRHPGSRARSFLDEVRGVEVAADTLVTGAQLPEAVEVLTPHAAAGRRWDRVAVVGVQDGIWPDLRLRDTLLGAQALVAALQDRPVSGQEAWRAALAQVRADELRQFHVAVTRARDHVLVTATSSPEEQPSGLLDLVEPGFRERPPEDVPAPMTLRGLVGELRRTAVRAHRAGDHASRDQAVEVLVHLAAHGVPGADPSSWWALRATSSESPLRPEGPVRVSPSRLQTYLDCSLRWFLTSRGAETGDAFGAELGTLVHDIVAAAPEASAQELSEELDRRWPDLGLEAGWVNDKARENAAMMLQRYERYVRESRATGRSVVGVELNLSLELRPRPQESGRAVRLVGAVDRLEVDEHGRAVVADLKTGRTSVTPQEAQRHAQLGAYQVAIEEGAFADQVGTVSGGARLIQLGASGPVERGQESLAQDEDPTWARRMILDVAEGMASSQFEARDLDRRCRRCPARFACPLQPEGAQR